MSDTFRAALGRQVVSRSSAEILGTVTHLVVDAAERRLHAIVVGKGRKARYVTWDSLTGFGPDAIMVIDEGVLREPSEERERAAAGGKLDLLDKRVLTELGTELGTIDDVMFDTGSGLLERLAVGGRDYPAGALLGSGSYAVVLAQAASDA